MRHPIPRCRSASPRGFGVLELLIAVGLGVGLLGWGLRILFSTVHAEERSGNRVLVAHQVARAASWIERDLDQVYHGPDDEPVEVLPVVRQGRIHPGARLALVCLDRDFRIRPVAWEFDPGRGRLTRYEAGGATRVFELGPGSIARFDRDDRNLDFDSEVVAGDFGNRLTYRFTGRTGSGKHAATFTLVGARSFRIEVSREAFPYWTPIAGTHREP